MRTPPRAWVRAPAERGSKIPRGTLGWGCRRTPEGALNASPFIDAPQEIKSMPRCVGIRLLAERHRYPLTDPPQFDILGFGPGWRGSNALRPIETARVHHSARRRSGRMAACGAGAAIDNASGGNSEPLGAGIG